MLSTRKYISFKQMSKKKILIVMLILQVIVCLFTPREVFLGDLIPRLMMIMYISLLLWLQLIPSVTHTKTMVKIAETNVLFRPKTSRAKEAKQRVRKSVVVVSFIIGISVLGYIVLFFSYVFKNYIWIINHFIKLTRIWGLIVLIGCIALLVRYFNISWNQKESVMSKNKISILGLIIQNILFSMILLIF